MGCSFEVTTNGMKTQRLMSKACFASINADMGLKLCVVGVPNDPQVCNRWSG